MLIFFWWGGGYSWLLKTQSPKLSFLDGVGGYSWLLKPHSPSPGQIFIFRRGGGKMSKKFWKPNLLLHRRLSLTHYVGRSMVGTSHKGTWCVVLVQRGRRDSVCLSLPSPILGRARSYPPQLASVFASSEGRIGPIRSL